MSYQSLEFILFCIGILAVYYLAGPKGQRWVLILANLAFYTASGFQYLPYLLLTMTATFFAGKQIGRIYQRAEERIAQCKVASKKKELRAGAKAKAKTVLLTGMALTLLPLILCKYTGFAMENINVLLEKLGISQLSMFRMVLPLGISFYSFMALSYILDVYWKRYPAEQSFLTYAVYLSYFPHVVQGPIDRFGEFRSQIQEGVAFDYQKILFGAQLMLWGLFQKLVIANRLGIYVDHILDRWETVNGFMLIAAILVYSIQIYADFSGCIDIVSGVSEMFGIRLRKNFNNPYFSRTMGEFWRRWHISLQEWFKDYVYFPVSTSGLLRKVKKYCKETNKPALSEHFCACFPILVVWLITGIWHGASWNFVIWGIFHAAVLIGSHLLEPVFKRLTQLLSLDTGNFGWHCIQMLRTYGICCIGRVFFRAPDLDTAFGIFRRIRDASVLAELFGSKTSYGLDTSNAVLAALSVLVLLVADILKEKMPVRETLAKQNTLFRWFILMAGIFAVIVFGIYGPGYDAASFIYEQF